MVSVQAWALGLREQKEDGSGYHFPSNRVTNVRRGKESKGINLFGLFGRVAKVRGSEKEKG